ncbi:MAG: hypothetical protein JWO64_1992, partial [Hyphomicrobiales bacterium]|nr:hypothetical protein [Hyphomicrobiales bacterium]
QNGDVAIFSRPLVTTDDVFPIGTECVVLRRLDTGDYEVEVMEPRPEVVRIPADALEPVEP